MSPKKSRQSGLLGWLTDAVVPIFAIDAKRRIRFVNPACETITGCTADQLIGQLCTYSSEPPDDAQIDSSVHRLCPPPSVFEGEHAEVPISFENSDGEIVAVSIRYVPLINSDGTLKAVLGSMTPLTDSASPSTVSPAQLLHAELANLRFQTQHRFQMSDLISQSPLMKRVTEQMEIAALSKVSVHLFGESGTGREAIARHIHQKGRHPSKVFVPVECSRLSKREIKRTLTRLFQEQQEDQNQLESFSPGTLFLHDVELLDSELQRLLVDQSQLAEKKNRPFIRLMSSSSCELKALLVDEKIDPEFYYLITSLTIELPPLRSRKEDIPLLAQAFLEEQNRHADKQIAGFSQSLLDRMQEYNWLRNLTELKAVVVELYDQHEGTGEMDDADFSFRFESGWDAQSMQTVNTLQPINLEEEIAEIERTMIRKALSQSKGNKSQAAKLLGMTRPRLYRRLETLRMINEQDKGES